MSKAVFGKTHENIRNRFDIRLISDNKTKLAAKPNYERCIIFDENFIAIYMKKTKLYFKKPVYVYILVCLYIYIYMLITDGLGPLCRT